MATTSDGTDPRAEPVARVGSKWILFIALANLGLFMAYFGALGVLLPNQVQAVAGSAHKITAFALVTGAGALCALIANPLAGALSDRTSSRFGRRHPWTLGGALFNAAAMVLLANQHSLFGVAVCWCLAQVGLNAMQAGLVAGVPDRVPVAQRGSVSAWFGIPQTVGVVIGVVLITQVVTGNKGYLLLAVTTVVLALPFVLSAPDTPLPKADRPALGWREFIGGFWLSPARHPDFGWAWLTRFLIVLGNGMAVLYLLYFLRDRIHYSRLFPGQQAEDGLVILLFIYSVGVTITAILGGMISDRSGRRRRLVALAGLVMAIPAVMLAFWPTWPVTIAAAAILGLGFGVYLAVDQALVTQVLPSAAGRAKDLGIISVASSGAQALAPAFAAPLVAHFGGYRSLYLAVAVVVVLSSVCVLRIRSVP
jgi:MFS family permease